MGYMTSIHGRNFGRDLDLNLLRVFAVVAETGGITEAAKRLFDRARFAIRALSLGGMHGLVSLACYVSKNIRLHAASPV